MPAVPSSTVCHPYPWPLLVLATTVNQRYIRHCFTYFIIHSLPHNDAYCHLFPSPTSAPPQRQAFLLEICAHADGNNYPPPRPLKYEDHDDFIDDEEKRQRRLLMPRLKSRP